MRIGILRCLICASVIFFKVHAKGPRGFYFYYPFIISGFFRSDLPKNERNKTEVLITLFFQSSFHMKSAAAFREAVFLIDCFLTCSSFISSWPFCLAIESSSSDPLILVISCKTCKTKKQRKSFNRVRGNG